MITEGSSATASPTYRFRHHQVDVDGHLGPVNVPFDSPRTHPTASREAGGGQRGDEVRSVVKAGWVEDHVRIPP